MVARTCGVLFIIAAVICLGIAIEDLVSSNDFDEEPTKFWLFFVGIFLLFLGGVGLQLGFGGAYARYAARELAPAAKETMGYLGLGANGVTCAACGAANDAGAKFCDDCGKPLTRACAQCGKANAGDARFCAECGTALA
jgi:hypothetical protein